LEAKVKGAARKTGKTSRHRGVTLFASQGKFQAFVKVEGKRFHCGMWSKEADAGLARDRAALFFGLDTPLNFPRRARRVGPASPDALIVEAKGQQRTRESSQYLGVHWNRQRQRWAAIICFGKKPVQIAQFDAAEDAAVAYDRVAIRVFGNEVERNFPRRRLKPANITEMRKWARRLWKKKTSSRFRGVTWSEKDRVWIAQIHPDGSRRHLGAFAVEEDAARAYDREARKVWGKRASLNFR
jgi:hypothetical protein